MTVQVPSGLAEATTLREGEDGRRWLAALPGLVDDACRRWGLVVDGAPTHGQVALVVPVQHPTGPAVLKVSFPHPGNLGEAGAQRTFAGRGAVRLLEADPSGLVLVLERAGAETLADHVARAGCSVEEAIEIAGDLARRLAVPPSPETAPLAGTLAGWRNELEDQMRAHPDALPGRDLDRARETIAHLATEPTSTMLHGDLHFGNVLAGGREPWLTIDPKGWFGSAAFDAFTVVAGGREQLSLDDGLPVAIRRRVSRFATAARVDDALALACCQARAVSSYLYQLDLPRDWFDAEFLRILAGADEPAGSLATG